LPTREDLSPESANWFPDEDFGRQRVHVIEYDRPQSDDDDAVTAQSIRLMQRLSNRDSHRPAVRAAAIRALGTTPNLTAKEKCDRIFEFVQRTVSYQHEDEMRTQFADLANFAYDQTLIAPHALLAMPQPAGDCVDYSMLVLALLRLQHIPAVFKTIAANQASTLYSHVYVVCQIGPGQFYAMDASNGPGPGFEFALPAGKKKSYGPTPMTCNGERRQ
jgi:transglutaminase-like putative cysteine protease